MAERGVVTDSLRKSKLKPTEKYLFIYICDPRPPILEAVLVAAWRSRCVSGKASFHREGE